MFKPTLLASLLYLTTSVTARLYTIQNNCPQGITLYINGVSQGRLAAGAVTTRTQTENWSGFIYTDANGGSVTGERTTRAGFYGEVGHAKQSHSEHRANTRIRMTITTLSLTVRDLTQA
jgi:hypothetical protein